MVEGIPVFVISLEGDDERRQPLLDQLAGLGLDFELVLGVDGRNGLSPEHEAIVDRPSAARKYGRPVSSAELACALSHRSVYGEIVGLRGEHALILEDDAIVDPRLLDFLASGLYRRFDLVMLYHSHARVRRRPEFDVGDISAYRLVLPSCGATGYIVSRRACRELLAATDPLSDLADWPMDIASLRSVALQPRLVTHHEPETAHSHLAAERHKPRRDPFRLLSRKFWMLWIRKRLSTRIS